MLQDTQTATGELICLIQQSIRTGYHDVPVQGLREVRDRMIRLETEMARLAAHEADSTQPNDLNKAES